MNENALATQPPALPAYSEQNVSMVQQLAQAQIQSAYIMAERHPRDWDVAEQKILKECRRPQFCAIDPDPKKFGSSIAMYGVPRGKKQDEHGKWVPNIVRDLTIRFAEMALPHIKNASVDLWPMGEDEQQRVFRVVRIDYESNVAEGEIIIVPKTVERKSTKDSDIVVSSRKNSYNETVHIIQATNEEMEQAKLVQYSKRKRNLVLSMIPGWLKEAAKAQILETQRAVDAQDPDAARKAIYGGFAHVGVSVEDIKAYLGHANDLSPAEMEDLRVLYAGIAGGHTTWKEIIAAKDESGDGSEDLDALINAEFEKLENTPAQVRKIKAKYIGRGKELLEWLQGEVAKKQNNGGKQEPSVPDPTSTATQQSRGTAGSQTGGSNTETKIESQTNSTSSSSAQNTSEPPVKQDPKPSPAPATKSAPPPVEEVW